MEEAVEKPPIAWQPFTPRGVAAFAQAPLGRLLLVQFVMASLTAVIVVWVVHGVWFPAVNAAIGQMPAKGQIRNGTLEWGGDNPARLAEGRFLAFTVDLKHEGGMRLPAHVQVEFGKKDLRMISLFGYARVAYPDTLNFPFNGPELGPWWGAWSPPILGLFAIGTLVVLFVMWSFLASAYALPVWLIAFFRDRKLNIGESWRLAGAALMPGALLMAASVFFYGLGTLGLIELFVIFLAHWVISWVYAWLGALCAPRHPATPVANGNPFA